MTAIVLAQKLLYSAGEFIGPYDNPLYNLWVKRISLAGLQATGENEYALNSLFSSNLIEAISREALQSRYATMPAPAERHVGVEESLRVGVAVTNLNGVGYGYPVTPGGEFVYIDYGDQLTREVIASSCDNAAFWEPLRQAAVACGAFPIAFRAQDVQRSAKEEAHDYPSENLKTWKQDPATFTFSDGGILQNQPLGMAKNLVDLIDPKHLNQERRFYLFVSPHAKDPAPNETFHAANADYLRLAQRLIDVVMGQSGFQDWITAKDMNQRIELLDTRARELQQAIARGEVDVPSLTKTAESLLKLFFPNGEHLSPGALEPEKLADAQTRIATQYKAEINALQTVPGQAEAFRDAVLAFETAAGLGARDHMTIYGVIAKQTELAGAGLQAFLGFFDQQFRDHDYDVGREHAQQVLKDQALAKPDAIGPFRYTPTEIRPIDHRLDGLRLRDVPAADMHAFKAGMRKRLNQMLREAWGPFFSLPAIPGSDLILDSLLNHLIARM
jgi:hypothetical protein